MTEEIKRSYIIPLRRGFVNTPKYKRTNKAVRVLREFLKKHMKAETIKIGPALNDLLWANGIKNPPGKVSVDVVKDKEGVVKVELKGVKYVDFKLAEKVNKNATFKEKLQSKVAATKSDKKDDKKDSKDDKKAEKKETKKEAKVETKTEKAETKPAKEEKAEKKAEVKTEAKETKAKEETTEAKKESAEKSTEATDKKEEQKE